MTNNKLDKATWAACPIIKSYYTPGIGPHECLKCPEYYIDPVLGKCTNHCRGAAQELAEAVLESQEST